MPANSRWDLILGFKGLSSSLCSFLHSVVTSSLLGSNIFLNTLFSNTHSPRSTLYVSDQVSHPYTTTGKITVLYAVLDCTCDMKACVENTEESSKPTTVLTVGLLLSRHHSETWMWELSVSLAHLTEFFCK